MAPSGKQPADIWEWDASVGGSASRGGFATYRQISPVGDHRGLSLARWSGFRLLLRLDLLEEGERVLRDCVGLRQQSCAGLDQDLRPRERRDLLGDVCVSNRTL